ncbi:MAG: hypothetical protein GX811_12605 [Lentisphaerae bacterium]|nr:hypothetical protein [Lentisphaerota bacterium]
MKMKKYNDATLSKSGQAFIELIVGLVVIMALLAGFTLVAQLTEAHSQAMNAAQISAAEVAMSDEYTPLLQPLFIADWGIGSDRRRYSSDDYPILHEEPHEITDNITDYVDASTLSTLISQNPISSIALDHNNTIEHFRLVPGSSQQTVPTMPIVRSLFYDRNNVLIRSEIWTTWLEGLY